MRVLHINSYYNGSPFYKQLYERQLALGYDIQVFVPVAQGFHSDFDFGGYTTISQNHGRLDRLLFPVKHKKILADIRRKLDIASFDVTHAHSLFSNGYIAMMLKRQFDVPYIVAVRNTDVNTFFARMPHMRSLGREILREAERVIFLSRAYERHALVPYLSEAELQALWRKSEVIPNGIDPFWLANRAEVPHTLEDGALRLLLIGRADRNKNVTTAAEAAKLLMARGHAVRFDVLLATIDDKRIMRRIQSYPFLSLHPRMDKRQLLQLYQQCDIFVLPSFRESFGLVYAEAMTQGLPVIYTQGQGFDGQFDDGEVGYAVDPNDPGAIAERIERILAHYPETSQNCIRQSARYDWGAFALRYDQIYSEVSARANS